MSRVNLFTTHPIYDEFKRLDIYILLCLYTVNKNIHLVGQHVLFMS